MSDIEIIKWMALAAGMILALIVITHFVPQSFAQRMCLANEYNRYDSLWHKTCLQDGLSYNCELPKQQTDIMGWQDHMKRAQECFYDRK